MRTRKMLAVLMALMVMVPNTLFMQGCSNEQTANPIESVAPTTDSIASRPQIPNAALRLASDTRQAIQQECWYALNQNVWYTHASPSNNTSNWSYMTNDINAYNWIKAKMGIYSSCWITAADGSTTSDIYKFWGAYKPKSFYRDIYGYSFYNSIGRGMQCRPFVRYVLYRSGTYQADWFPSYADAINNFNSSRSYTRLAGQCRVGDVLQTKWSNGHSMIVTDILAGTPGQSVTRVRVVDANWVTGAGNEVIGRHDIGIIYPGQSGDGGLGDLDSYITIDVGALGAR